MKNKIFFGIHHTEKYKDVSQKVICKDIHINIIRTRITSSTELVAIFMGISLNLLFKKNCHLYVILHYLTH